MLKALKDCKTSLNVNNLDSQLDMMGSSDHFDGEDKRVTKFYTLCKIQDLTIINEIGLYSLALPSKMILAKISINEICGIW